MCSKIIETNLNKLSRSNFEKVQIKLIVGLGNPGEKYKNNRHNVGYIILDQFAQQSRVQFSNSIKTNSLVTQVKGLMLCKPQSFMNTSGNSVLKTSKFFKISPSDILIMHDDLDLDFGVIKLQRDKSSAGHNGVQDVIDKLGTKDFWRLRVGIGRPQDDTPIEEYVLKNLTQEQLTQLRNIDLHEYILVEE